MFCRSSRQRVFESLTRVSFSVASFEIARAWPNRNDRARFERKKGALQFWNFPFRRVRFSKSHRSRFDRASNSANSRTPVHLKISPCHEFARYAWPKYRSRVYEWKNAGEFFGSIPRGLVGRRPRGFRRRDVEASFTPLENHARAR